VLLGVGLGHRAVGDLAVLDVQALAEPGIVGQRGIHAKADQLGHVPERGVAKAPEWS
jgi:hypothetical protein